MSTRPSRRDLLRSAARLAVGAPFLTLTACGLERDGDGLERLRGTEGVVPSQKRRLSKVLPKIARNTRRSTMILPRSPSTECGNSNSVCAGDQIPTQFFTEAEKESF